MARWATREKENGFDGLNWGENTGCRSKGTFA